MTKGSHATFEDYPRVCATCGLRVKITGGESLWFETDAAGRKRSYHFKCRAGRVAA